MGVFMLVAFGLAEAMAFRDIGTRGRASCTVIAYMQNG